MITHTKPACILFDLDNTLYSSRWGLEKNVGRRVNEYIAGFLGLSSGEAWALRCKRLTAAGYGTTLEWLIAEHGLAGPAVDGYFDFIHPADEADALPSDPELDRFLAAIDLPKAILTNSPREHALRILDKLGITGRFTSIFDIRYNELKGKPHPRAFYRALETLGLEASACLFVDDARLFVEGYRALGGPGVLFDESGSHPEFPGPRIGSLDELLPLVL